MGERTMIRVVVLMWILALLFGVACYLFSEVTFWQALLFGIATVILIMILISRVRARRLEQVNYDL